MTDPYTIAFKEALKEENRQKFIAKNESATESFIEAGLFEREALNEVKKVIDNL